MPKRLIDHILKVTSLNDSELLTLSKYIRTRKFKKKEFLLSEGEICRDLYFVEKGCVRMYFINKKAAEQIAQFALDGWWISDFSSYLDKKPSDYYIQCIEETEIVYIDKLRFDNLLEELPQLEKYFRLIFQKALAASQIRAKLVYELSKEEFYQHFSTSFPDFMQRVPQYMIASYLGLTPEYMSELRKKKE